MNHLYEIKYYELCVVCHVSLTTTKSDHDKNKNPILGWSDVILVLNSEARCFKQSMHSRMWSL